MMLQMLTVVQKYKKDAKLAERISRLSVHSTKKKLSRIGRKMIGTQVLQSYSYILFVKRLIQI